MNANKELSPIVTALFTREKEFGISIYQDKQVQLFRKKINFTRKLDEGNGATVKKQQKTISNFSLDALTIAE